MWRAYRIAECGSQIAEVVDVGAVGKITKEKIK